MVIIDKILPQISIKFKMSNVGVDVDGAFHIMAGHPERQVYGNWIRKPVSEKTDYMTI